MSDTNEYGPELRQAGVRLREQLAETERELDAGGDVEAAYLRVRAAVDELLAVCRATGIVGSAVGLPSSEMWAEAGDLLGRGWMLARARHKPRGYAGDYELLGRMYDDRRCDDPLGSLLDRYFQDDAAPIAVRNRMWMMRDGIVKRARRDRREFNVAIVGSAFGLEVRDALASLNNEERSRVAITLLDMDPAAIEHAREQLAPWIAADRLTAVPTNVFRLPLRLPLAEPLAGTDLLYCPGIFDYLDPAAAAEMLRLFWRQLAPGGEMTVLQFAPHNPSRALMEWIGNWYLIYRDEEEFRQVVADSGIPGSCAEFGAEPLGVDLYVTARKV